MTASVEALSYQRSHARVAERWAEVAPGVDPILIHDDASLTRAGTRVDAADISPEIAWLARDFFVEPGSPGRAFLQLVLASPTVRWVQSGLAGLDLPVFPKLAAKGVRITSNDASADAIAEFVLAQVLSVFHPAAERLELQRARRWGGGVFREIQGSRWLVVGYGNVGRATGRRAAALGAHVVGVRKTDRRGADIDAGAAEIVGAGDVPARVGEADVVLLTVPGGTETRHLVGAGFLARMREDAVLVNVSRGSVVDEAALLDGLDQGRPGWAVLDVFEKEPLPEESPLWAHPRVRVTAHKAAASTAVTRRGDVVFLENLRRYVAGDPLRLEVDPARWGVP